MTKPSDDNLTLHDFLPDTSDGYTAHAGEARDDAHKGHPSKDAIIAALETIQDPEIPVNIYELGLIYDIITDEIGDVRITMSLTAPGCPVAGEMPKQVADAVAKNDDVGRVSVSLVWDPAWTPDRMSEDAKMALDFSF